MAGSWLHRDSCQAEVQNLAGPDAFPDFAEFDIPMNDHFHACRVPCVGNLEVTVPSGISIQELFDRAGRPRVAVRLGARGVSVLRSGRSQVFQFILYPAEPASRFVRLG